VPHRVRPYAPLKDLAVPVLSASVRAYVRSKCLILNWLPPQGATCIHSSALLQYYRLYTPFDTPQFWRNYSNDIALQRTPPDRHARTVASSETLGWRSHRSSELYLPRSRRAPASASQSSASLPPGETPAASAPIRLPIHANYRGLSLISCSDGKTRRLRRKRA
jgi:hypothetical protein